MDLDKVLELVEAKWKDEPSTYYDGMKDLIQAITSGDMGEVLDLLGLSE